MKFISEFFSNFRAGLGLYEAATPSRYYSMPNDLNFSLDEMLDLADIELIRSLGKEIYSNFSPVAGAIHDKATSAIGTSWVPIYFGEDSDWGVKATQWLKEHYKVMDSRGHPFNFINNQWLGSVTMDREGEYFIMPYLAKGGYPKFQYLEAHQCGSRSGNAGKIEGLEFRNGIYYNGYGQPVFYNMLGKEVANDRLISASNIIHVYEPRWYSQGRGIPATVQSILDWKDSKKFRENEKTASNIFSSLTILEKNATGKADPTKAFFQNAAKGTNQPPPGATSERKLAIEEYLRGSIRLIKNTGKSELEAFKYNRPANEVQAFQRDIIRGAFSGMDWPIEQAYDMTGAGTAQVRSVTNKCQKAVDRRQYCLLYPAAKQCEFSLAAAAEMGEIPPLPLDWYKWAFAMPSKMTNDAYREAAQDREDYKIGFVSLREIYAKRGEWWVDHIDQKFAEEQYLDAKALETGIGLERVRMLTPNGNPVVASDEASQDEADEKTDDKDKKEKSKKKEKKDEQ